MRSKQYAWNRLLLLYCTATFDTCNQIYLVANGKWMPVFPAGLGVHITWGFSPCLIASWCPHIPSRFV